MLCKKCGTSVYEGISFCPNCGAQMDVLNSSVQSTYNSQSVVQQYQQPVYNQQPQVSNNSTYNNGGNNFNNNDNKASTGLIVGVLIAVIAAFGVIYFMFNDKDKDKDSNSNSNSNVTSNVVSNSNSNVTSNIVSNTTSQITSNKPSNVVSNKPSNKTSQVISNKVSNKTSQVTSNKPVTNTNYKSIKHNGYILQIPKKYSVLENSSEKIVLSESGTDKLVGINVSNGNYSNLKSVLINNLSEGKKYFESQGAKLNVNPYLKTYNGVEYLVTDVTMQGNSMILAYAKISSSKVFIFVVPKASYLNDFSYTVKTAKVG